MPNRKFPGRTAIQMEEILLAAPFTATMAEIIAGKTIVAARKPNQILKPVGFRMEATGTFSTLTDIRLASDNATPVEIVTVTQSNISGRMSLDTGTLTVGAGMDANLGAGDGIKLRQTGSDMTGGGSLVGVVYFLVTSQ